jgi:hypothetical protein
MLSLLYIVLIGLFLVELAIVTWTVNFLRKYAFRPNSALAHGHEAHEVPRTAWAGARQESAATYEDELFEHARDVNRRH